MFFLERSDLRSNQNSSFALQLFISGTIVEDLVKSSYWKRLKSSIKSEFIIYIFFLERLWEECSVRRIEFICGNFRRNSPSLSKGIKAIDKCQSRIVSSLDGCWEELQLSRVEFWSGQLFLSDVVLLEISSQIVLLSQSHGCELTSELFSFIPII